MTLNKTPVLLLLNRLAKIMIWISNHIHSFLWDVIIHPCPSLTHWGRVTHICVGNLTIIGPDNGLSPGRRQAIIWTNDGILLIGPWGTNLNEILIGIQTFSLKEMHLKMSSAKWRRFCLGLNVLTGAILLLKSGHGWVYRSHYFIWL